MVWKELYCDANLELGHCYNAGLGVPQDYKMAMKCYKKALYTTKLKKRVVS